MVKNKEIKHLKNIQKNALVLYTQGCMPAKLCKMIQEAQLQSEEYICFLMDMSEELIRTKGYYKGSSIRTEKANEYIAINLDLFMKGLYRSQRKGEP